MVGLHEEGPRCYRESPWLDVSLIGSGGKLKLEIEEKALAAQRSEGRVMA